VYALLTAQGISQVGNMMTIVAGPWFVLQTTGSAAKTGLVGAAFALGLLMPILGGPLVDRLGFRRGSVLADIVSGATVASLDRRYRRRERALHRRRHVLDLGALVAVGVPRSVDTRERRPVEGGGRRYLAELADGLRFVRSKTFLMSMILVSTVGNFFDQPLLTVIAPVYAKQIYGSPASFGALVGSFGAGAFAGSLLFGAVGRTWPRRRMFLTSYVVGAGLIYGTLALSPPLAVAIVAAVAAGLAFGPVNPIFATVTQENTPPHLLGRVFGALTTIAQAAIPIGALVAGVAVQQAGLIPTIVGMGVVYVVVTIGMFFNPALRGMDVRREPVAEPTDVRVPAQDGEAMMASRTTDIH
jgi:MFS family permease